VNFCRGNLIVARNQLGKVLWQRTIPKGRFAEPGYWPDTPQAPYVVVWQSDINRDDNADFIALSATEGSTVWTRKTLPFGALRAVSRDGSKQAFFYKGKLEITALPQANFALVPEVKENVDAVFSDDQRTLVCLPALVTVSEDKTNYTYTVARKSTMLRIVDAEKGSLITQFELKHPAVEQH
jgi:hypothetical protein